MTPFSGLKLQALDASGGLRNLVCDAIKRAITEMDIYGHPGALWLDERQLSQDLGVSRTPIREALGSLEQEGFVRSVPRRGVYVVKKTKREIVEMITVWAAIESMAARLAAQRASDEQLHGLRAVLAPARDDAGDGPAALLDDYSQANMAFHRAIIGMAGCTLMSEMTDAMFMHMRAVRAVAMGQDNRVQRSLADHAGIIDALERRDPDLAERLVREHTLGLAAHVEAHGDSLDGDSWKAPAETRPRRRSRGEPFPATDRSDPTEADGAAATNNRVRNTIARSPSG